MRRTHRRSRKQRSVIHDLSMTSLIDTALTLLMVFMIATPAIHNAIKVTLPNGNSQETTAQQSDELVVFIQDSDINEHKLSIDREYFIFSLVVLIGLLRALLLFREWWRQRCWRRCKRLRLCSTGIRVTRQRSEKRPTRTVTTFCQKIGLDIAIAKMLSRAEKSTNGRP